MPRRRLRDRSGIAVLTHDLRQDLEHGPRGGLSRSQGYVTPDAMTLRAAWVTHRAKLMEDIEAGRFASAWLVGQRPWAFWACDVAPKDRGAKCEVASVDEKTRTLRRIGRLTPAEEALLAAEHDEKDRTSPCRCASCLPTRCPTGTAA